MNKWHDKVTESPVADLSVVIGRFQPVHNGHMKLFKKAAETSSNCLVLVGSSFIARNMKNPFTFIERSDMIETAIKDAGLKSNFNTRPIVDDLYNDQRWIGEVQAAINDELINKLGLDPNKSRVNLIGHYKDNSSYYLNIFPRYKFVEVSNHAKLDGTSIRNWIFGKQSFPKNAMTSSVEKYLENWANTKLEKYQDLCHEHRFILDYKKQFSSLKYPPVFVTADAVVINKGHILLVRRGSYPGKGLWALPGGFLNQNETIETAILRELIEETQIDVDHVLLKAGLKGTHVFDAPTRSLRGRTITHAGLIVLNTRELPLVKGSDDADKAKWVPISDFYEMSEEMFEDHHSIGQYMINRA